MSIRRGVERDHDDLAYMQELRVFALKLPSFPTANCVILHRLHVQYVCLQIAVCLHKFACRILDTRHLGLIIINNVCTLKCVCLCVCMQACVCGFVCCFLRVSSSVGVREGWCI